MIIETNNNTIGNNIERNISIQLVAKWSLGTLRYSLPSSDIIQDLIAAYI